MIISKNQQNYRPQFKARKIAVARPIVDGIAKEIEIYNVSKKDKDIIEKIVQNLNLAKLLPSKVNAPNFNVWQNFNIHLKLKIFAFAKRIYLGGRMKGLPQDNLTPDIVAMYAAKALAEECRVVESDGREAIVPLRKGLSALKLSAFSGIKTADGKLATILVVARGGIFGLFLYREGDDYLSEMIDPAVETPVEIVEGERFVR